MAATTWSEMEADRAFGDAARARRLAALRCRLHGRTDCARLPVYDAHAARGTGATGGHGIREIPVDAIRGTLEPSRAAQFDPAFRPTARTRSRWQRVWLAAHSGSVLPPISVVQVGDAYAVRDGHHRVSVARALGALAIDAIVA